MTSSSDSRTVLESSISNLSIGQWAFIWGIVVFWNALSGLAFVLGVADLIEDGQYLPAGIVSLLFLVGIGMIAGLIYLHLREKKFGPSHLYLDDDTPISLGSTLKGKVLAPQSVLTKGSQIEVILNCTHRDRESEHGTDDQEHSDMSKLVWQSKETFSPMELSTEEGKVAVPVDFEIPHDAGDTNTGDYDVWKLSIKSELPGIDYGAHFDLPVEKTADSDPELTMSRIDSRTDETLDEQELTVSRVVRDSSDNLNVVVEPFRFIYRGTVWGIISAVLAGGVFYFVTMAEGTVIRWIFAIVLALFGLLAVYSSLHYLFGQSHVEIKNDKLYLEKSWLGLLDKTIEFSLDEIQKINVDRNEQSGSSDNETMTFVLQVETKQGESTNIAEISENREEVRYIKQQLEEEMNL